MRVSFCLAHNLFKTVTLVFHVLWIILIKEAITSMSYFDTVDKNGFPYSSALFGLKNGMDSSKLEWLCVIWLCIVVMVN